MNNDLHPPKSDITRSPVDSLRQTCEYLLSAIAALTKDYYAVCRQLEELKVKNSVNIETSDCKCNLEEALTSMEKERDALRKKLEEAKQDAVYWKTKAEVRGSLLSAAILRRDEAQEDSDALRKELDELKAGKIIVKERAYQWLVEKASTLLQERDALAVEADELQEALEKARGACKRLREDRDAFQTLYLTVVEQPLNPGQARTLPLGYVNSTWEKATHVYGASGAPVPIGEVDGPYVVIPGCSCGLRFCYDRLGVVPIRKVEK